MRWEKQKFLKRVVWRAMRHSIEALETAFSSLVATVSYERSFVAIRFWSLYLHVK